MNQALSDVQAGFRKQRGTRDQIASIHWIIKKSKEIKKNIYMIQLSHPSMNAGKTIALVIWTFDCKVMSLLFNMLSRLAPHSSTLAWKIPWMEEPCGLQSMGSLRVRHDWESSLSLSTFMHWRRKWQPTPVFLPGESQGQQSLVGCCL